MTENRERSPWFALAALCVGFFMILVDVTIVSVAQKSIMIDLRADLNSVVWVTSAYLLAGAVPLLVSGRLGDRFGPRPVYLVGLVVFTAASAWCGCSRGVGELIAARTAQGVGSALMTPQTMALITRVFPGAQIGSAMGAWGATAGVATLFGPLAGGVIVDRLGWQWIFFINVPIGLAGFVLAARLLPRLPSRRSPLDAAGVVLSGVGLFLLVLGLQEGERWDWDARPWALILLGLVVLAGFVMWEGKRPRAPLMPLELFRDRNFTVSSAMVAAVSFTMSGFMLPAMLYLQLVLGFSAVHAALATTPMALVSGVLAPLFGRLADRLHPTAVVGSGVVLMGAGVCWFAAVATANAGQWELVAPMAVVGAGVGATYSPLAAAATRNLAVHAAGAGSGVYNTTRMVGSVLGAAAVGGLMQMLVADKLPGQRTGRTTDLTGGLPEGLRPAFSSAMSQSMLLCVAVLACAALVAVWYGSAQAEPGSEPAAAKPQAV